jgi:hypothetical protein
MIHAPVDSNEDIDGISRANYNVRIKNVIETVKGLKPKEDVHSQ